MAQSWARGCAHRGCGERIRGEGAYCEEHKKARWKTNARRAREIDSPEQKFYNTTSWAELSRAQRAKEPFCRECMRFENARATFGQETDHRIPLKLAWKLRLDRTNLQTLCRSCHGKKRAAEGRMYNELDSPRAQCTLVTGPPGAGKTTYVNSHATRGDLILDLDQIWSALSNQTLYDRPKGLLSYVLEVRAAVLARYVNDGVRRPRAWFIITAMTADERKFYRQVLAPCNSVVLETPRVLCLQRIERDPTRPAKWGEQMQSIIDKWWDDYEPSDFDEVVRP